MNLLGGKEQEGRYKERGSERNRDDGARDGDRVEPYW